MKRISALILALLLTAGTLASCGKDNSDETTGDTSAVETTETGSPEANAPETDGGETNAPENDAGTAADGAKATLNGVYGAFLDKLAPAFGATRGEEISSYFAGPEMISVFETDSESGEEFSYEMPLPGPGTIDLSNTDNLYPTLLPSDQADKLQSAACFYNMMNMNNGTFSAFELKDAAEAEAVAGALKDAITGNQWMCGFPERYLIVNVDGVIISAFGLTDAVNAMKDAVTEAHTGAEVLFDEAL
ncbi:MAG: hypothetical protein E7638_08465 [Ruminococcaceae bacterium]|nr:hypothetical protein [Oscillospiraceae bacterium]